MLGTSWIMLFVATAAAGWSGERTLFQTGSPWIPELDLRSDVAIVYGVNPSLADRLAGWRERGYRVHLMTGIAWGGYADYLNGNFDGQDHWDEAQTDRNEEQILHGPQVPYLVPTGSFARYMIQLVRSAVDLGVEAVHLEEPEFWARAGYSPAFQRAYREHYGEPWQPPDSSPTVAYRAAQLKALLYRELLDRVFADLKAYTNGRVWAIVPTHTLVNYATWRIVSPEAMLAEIEDVDGVIAQTWTGTARTPNRYRGVRRERTFATALLEYHSAVALFQPAGKTLYFLTDPVEDDPNHTWTDYRRNYHATYTAQLLLPTVNRYEVMPWPNRVFRGTYPVEGSQERRRIPPDYATELLVLINVLNRLPRQEWTDWAAERPIGLALSNGLMYQRQPPFDGRDPDLSGFFGLAMPLVRYGLPFRMVCLDHLGRWERLEGVRVLLLSYEAMKPQRPTAHAVLADWVRNGGALLYVGTDEDPFQEIDAWWQRTGSRIPLEDLTARLGIKTPPTAGRTVPSWWRVGEGVFGLWRADPRRIADNPRGPEHVLEAIQTALQRVDAEPVRPTPVYHVQRGPFEVVAVVDEGPQADPYRLKGLFLDLFDSELPVVREKTVRPGEQAFLLAIDRWPAEESWVLAAASRPEEEEACSGCYRVRLVGPAGTRGVARIRLPGPPQSVQASPPLEEQTFDPESKTLWIAYPNRPEGVTVQIAY